MKATARTLRITPKKLNLIADLVRNKDAVEALQILKFAPKKGAKLLNKVLSSAVANATNNFKQDEKSLYIKEILVGKAPSYKRWLPVSRGRVHPIIKRNAHITITIGVKEGASEKTAPQKTAKSKPAAKKTAAPKPAAKAPKAAKAQPKKKTSEPDKA